MISIQPMKITTNSKTGRGVWLRLRTNMKIGIAKRANVANKSSKRPLIEKLTKSEGNAVLTKMRIEE